VSSVQRAWVRRTGGHLRSRITFRDATRCLLDVRIVITSIETRALPLTAMGGRTATLKSTLSFSLPLALGVVGINVLLAFLPLASI
jgi:hypothetical protein